MRILTKSMALKFQATIAQVTSRKVTNGKGQNVTYYSAFALDNEPNPLLRFPGQVEFQPNEEEIKTLNICEGAQFDLSIMQVLNLRNGVPVVQAKLSPVSKK